MTDTVIVRDATCSDVRDIAAVHVASWQTSYAGIVPDAYLPALRIESRLPLWQQLLCIAGRMSIVVVAENAAAHGVVGFASAEPSQPDDPEYPYELHTICLLAEHRRQGIGRRLMQATVGQLQQRGVPGFLLWVLAANLPARRFCAGLGGHLVREQTTTIGGKDLAEVAYGWSNLPALLARLC